MQSLCLSAETQHHSISIWTYSVSFLQVSRQFSVRDFWRASIVKRTLQTTTSIYSMILLYGYLHRTARSLTSPEIQREIERLNAACNRFVYWLTSTAFTIVSTNALNIFSFCIRRGMGYPIRNGYAVSTSTTSLLRLSVKYSLIGIRFYLIFEWRSKRPTSRLLTKRPEFAADLKAPTAKRISNAKYMGSVCFSFDKDAC